MSLDNFPKSNVNSEEQPEDLSRREFLKGGAQALIGVSTVLGGFGAATEALAALYEGEREEPKQKENPQVKEYLKKIEVHITNLERLLSQVIGSISEGVREKEFDQVLIDQYSSIAIEIRESSSKMIEVLQNLERVSESEDGRENIQALTKRLEAIIAATKAVEGTLVAHKRVLQETGEE